MRDPQLPHRLHDFLADLLRLLAPRVEQEDRKLLAAVARGEVERPARETRKRARNGFHRCVAGLVAVAVVEGLEVIDVGE